MTKIFYTVIFGIITLLSFAGFKSFASPNYTAGLQNNEKFTVTFAFTADKTISYPDIQPMVDGPITLTIGKDDNATTNPRIVDADFLQLYKNNFLEFASTEGFYIASVTLNYASIGSNRLKTVECTPEQGFYNIDSQKWVCLNTRPDYLKIESNDGYNNNLSSVEVTYRKMLERSPAPQILKYNTENQTITLVVRDENGIAINDCEIAIGFSRDENTIDNCDNPYTGIITLDDYFNDTVPSGMYYLWAKARIEGHDFSEITLLQSIKYNGQIIGPTVTYREATEIDLQDGCWYIIVAPRGGSMIALSSMGEDGDFTGNLIGTKTDTEFIGAKNEYDNLGILEFMSVDGHLVEKNTGNYLTPRSSSSRSLSNIEPESTVFEIRNGEHILTVNGQKLQFTGRTNKFGFNSETYKEPIKLYTTGSDKNTDTYIISTDDNTPIEYYNLQGIKVENPSHGLYIKRQGQKITKILIQ